MNFDDQIAGLLGAAAPLRLLSEDDPKQAPLAGIIDEINALRAKQAKAIAEGPQAVVIEPDQRGKAALLSEAKSLGLAADGRWSMQRLESEIAIARNAHDTVVDGLK